MSKKYFNACKFCKDKRHPGCHSSCQDYIQSKSEYMQDQSLIKEIKQKEQLANGYQIEKILKCKHKKQGEF